MIFQTPTPQEEISPPPHTTHDEDDFSSEKGVNYTKLRDLLKAGEWKKADYETYVVMIQAVGKKENDYFISDELLNFPCTDLRTIDRLWVKYSNGRFGFSVQKQIYLEVGGQADGEFYEEAWNKFGSSVGWKVNNSWLDYDDVPFSTSAPVGHLPFFWGEGFVLFVGRLCGVSLASRIVNCNI
jgi:GUN4-like